MRDIRETGLPVDIEVNAKLPAPLNRLFLVVSEAVVAVPTAEATATTAALLFFLLLARDECDGPEEKR